VKEEKLAIIGQIEYAMQSIREGEYGHATDILAELNKAIRLDIIDVDEKIIIES
jgi:hypothetical protein